MSSSQLPTSRPACCRHCVEEGIERLNKDLGHVRQHLASVEEALLNMDVTLEPRVANALLANRAHLRTEMQHLWNRIHSRTLLLETLPTQDAIDAIAAAAVHAK